MLWHTGENKMIKGFILALQFLTRIPIKISIDFNDKNIRNSIFFFPLVGGLIGVFGGIIYHYLSPFNINIASFLTLLFTIILTGGLHIDGLSDTFDGFLANKDKEKTLEIMKDSRVGAFGVLSIVMLVMFKYILISNVGVSLPIALTLSFANSRLVASRVIMYKKVARPGGLGELFHKSNPEKLIFASSLIYLVLLIFLNVKFIMPLALTFISGEIISRVSNKKIRGLTGDVYGAIIEIGDAVSLLGFWGILLWI